MSFVQQLECVKKITDALGLGRVRSLTMHFEVNSIPTVDVEFFPDKQQIDGVAEALESKRFRLVEVEDGG